MMDGDVRRSLRMEQPWVLGPSPPGHADLKGLL